MFVGVLDRLVIRLKANKLKSRLFTLRVYISARWQQITALVYIPAFILALLCRPLLVKIYLQSVGLI